MEGSKRTDDGITCQGDHDKLVRLTQRFDDLIAEHVIIVERQQQMLEFRAQMLAKERTNAVWWGIVIAILSAAIAALITHLAKG